MAVHALEDLDDASDATRAFLRPIDRTRWIRLALVVLLVGGPGTNLTSIRYNLPADRVPPRGGPDLGQIDVGVWLVIGTVVGVVVLLGLLLLLVGSAMEFVLVESLRNEEVLVRRYWGDRWRQGVRLFGFRLVVRLLVLGGLAVLAALVVVPAAVGGGPGPGTSAGGLGVLAVLLLLPVFLVLALVVGLVDGFTTAFVVPVMVLEGVGVLDGWRRLWPTIVAHPWQYLAYAVAGFVLTALGGVLVALVVAVAALLLLIPFGIVGAAGVLLLSAVPPLGAAVLAVVGLLFALAMLVVVALAQVPVVTYLRYYALLVLGDVDERLDLVPERRAAIRSHA